MNFNEDLRRQYFHSLETVSGNKKDVESVYYFYHTYGNITCCQCLKGFKYHSSCRLSGQHLCVRRNYWDSKWLHLAASEVRAGQKIALIHFFKKYFYNSFLKIYYFTNKPLQLSKCRAWIHNLYTFLIYKTALSQAWSFVTHKKNYYQFLPHTQG